MIMSVLKQPTDCYILMMKYRSGVIQQNEVMWYIGIRHFFLSALFDANWKLYVYTKMYVDILFPVGTRNMFFISCQISTERLKVKVHIKEILVGDKF
jgi:hypothetical protein